MEKQWSKIHFNESCYNGKKVGLPDKKEWNYCRERSELGSYNRSVRA